MKVLSIDVGVKNLAYCKFDIVDDKVNISSWENVCVTETNCKKLKIEELTDDLMDLLHSSFDDSFEADIVLIENQPMLKNGMMKTVAVMIYTYFNVLKHQFGNVRSIKFISATNKLKCKKNKSEQTKSYKDRKLCSINLARLYVESTFPERLSWFDMNKKKDDISDAMLQGIYYIEHVLKVNF